jgi:hypothetical protein
MDAPLLARAFWKTYILAQTGRWTRRAERRLASCRKFPVFQELPRINSLFRRINSLFRLRREFLRKLLKLDRFLKRLRRKKRRMTPNFLFLSLLPGNSAKPRRFGKTRAGFTQRGRDGMCA